MLAHALDGRLRPAILELCGSEVDAQILRLRSLEEGAAGLVASAAAAGGALPPLTAHYLLPAGAAPGAAADPSLQQDLQSDDGPPAAIVCEGAAHHVRYSLRRFAAQQFALVERALHGRLCALHGAIPAAVRQGLCFHFILTVRRDTGALGEQNPVHADTFDGTMLAFALMCTKVPTPVYPAAAFAPSALERFVQEAAGAPGVTRPAEIHAQPATPARAAREGCLLLLPPGVAHSIPNTALPIEAGEAVSEQGVLLSRAGEARWFCRVSLEVVPAPPAGAAAAGGAWAQWTRQWPGADAGAQRGTRMRVALLAARHVWGDAEFAERARALLGLDMTGWW